MNVTELMEQACAMILEGCERQRAGASPEAMGELADKYPPLVGLLAAAWVTQAIQAVGFDRPVRPPNGN